MERHRESQPNRSIQVSHQSREKVRSHLNHRIRKKSQPNHGIAGSTPGENPEPTPEADNPQETAEQENTVDGMSTKKNSAAIRYLTVTSVMGSGSRKVISTDTGSDTTGSGDAGTSYGGTAAEIQQQIKDKEKEIRDYQLDIKEANLEIKDIQKKLNNQTIKSTLNGVVKTVGDPEKESNDGKPLIQVVSSEGLYVQGTVSESKMNKLKVGATLSGYSYDNGVSFTAEVREISPYPSNNGQDGANASYYPFTAYIADASGLSNNSWAELTLLDEGDGQGQGIYLEKPFVRTENGQYYVMKDDGTGHLTKQIVQVGGIQYGSSYQITGGLSMMIRSHFLMEKMSERVQRQKKVRLMTFITINGRWEEQQC